MKNDVKQNEIMPDSTSPFRSELWKFCFRERICKPDWPKLLTKQRLEEWTFLSSALPGHPISSLELGFAANLSLVRVEQ